MDTNSIIKEIGLRGFSLPNEQWREVACGNGNYFISDSGRLLTTNWRIAKRWAIMKPAKDPSGYWRTMIVKKKEKRAMTIKIHRLVAEAFVPNPMSLPEVNHKNGIKTDNRPQNLEWVTHQQNIQHSFKNRLQTNDGSKNPFSILTEEQVREIKQTKKPLTNAKRIALATMYGVAEGTIKHLVYRPDKFWPHVR